MSNATHPDLAALFAHPDAVAFVRKMAADPADDLPRLTFADWLEERGQGERAEFIRVQIELAKPDRLAACDCGEPWSGPVALNSFPVPLTVCRRHRCYGYGPPWPDAAAATARRVKLAARGRELLLANAWVMLPGGCELILSPDRWTYAGTPGGTARRGFIGEVRAPLAVLFGGRCRRCDGDGQRHGSDRTCPPTPCTVCSGTGTGTGTTPGVAAALGRAHPLIERVMPTDREPLELDGWFCWYDNEPADSDRNDHPPSDLGRAVFARLVDGSPSPTQNGLCWPTLNEALAARDAACLVELRRRAATPA